MIVTEEDAKTKWCPMVRHIERQDSGESSNNRCFPVDDPKKTGISNNVWNKCIGSHCMMWRRTNAVSAIDLRGYCGLAGKT